MRRERLYRMRKYSHLSWKLHRYTTLSIHMALRSKTLAHTLQAPDLALDQ